MTCNFESAGKGLRTRTANSFLAADGCFAISWHTTTQICAETLRVNLPAMRFTSVVKPAATIKNTLAVGVMAVRLDQIHWNAESPTAEEGPTAPQSRRAPPQVEFSLVIASMTRRSARRANPLSRPTCPRQCHRRDRCRLHLRTGQHPFTEKDSAKIWCIAKVKVPYRQQSVT